MAVEANEAESVLVARDGPVMRVTLNRPHVSNAIDLGMTLAIGDALEEAHHDADVRVVLVTGAGERAFCAGADLRARARRDQVEPTDPHRREWGFGGYVRHHIDKPTIAVVNGAAVAGGAEIVLASDLVVASSTASIGFPEVKVGLFAGAGGAFRLPRQMPPKIALELMLTGEFISAERAQELGLVNRVVAPAALQDEAMALAQKIARYPAEAVRATIRVARGMVDRTVPAEAASWELTMREVDLVEALPDAGEGAAAFVDKRAPAWSQSPASNGAVSGTSTTEESR